MMRAFADAPSRPPAARHRRGHLARHHRDLHLCPGALRGPRRHLGRRRADARLRALPFRLHGALSPARERRCGDRGRRRGRGATSASSASTRAPRPAPGGGDLAGAGRPKVIARLPFIERPGHPAGTPVFVISKPLADAAVRDVVLYAAQLRALARRRRRSPRRASAARSSPAPATRAACPSSSPPPAGSPPIACSCPCGSRRRRNLVEIGSHAERFRVG